MRCVRKEEGEKILKSVHEGSADDIKEEEP